METIHVKFNELTAMASECNNAGPAFNCLNFQDSLEDSKINDSAENTLDSKDTPSLSSIVVEEDEAPQILTSSEEPIANESTTSVSNENDNETIQKDVLAFDGNDFYDPLYSLMLEEADLSLTF
ncbi:hypothetical protein Tco_1475564 [Tanacetum coccineum]